MSQAHRGLAIGDWRLEIHDVLPSTSDVCRARAAAGEPEGLAVLARRQTRGRGSRGRDWQSPPGNLYLSALLRPREPAREAAQWSLLVAVALAEALAGYLPASAWLRVKWPNDLLLDGGKLAGILLDTSASDGMLDWLIIGVGVNLEVAPPVGDRPVAALADVASPPAPEILARDLLERIGHWRRVRRHGFAPIRAAWLAVAPDLGSPVTLRVGETTICGGFAGLGQDGSLLLATVNGTEAFGTGEVLG